MAVIDVYNVKGEKILDRDIKDEIFDVHIREDILHQVVRSQLASYRSGSASSKNRSEVKASTRKLWRQKGTGRARVGAASSPSRRGGGVAFGPIPRDYSFKINKKVKKKALRMALADKFKTGQILVIDKFHIDEIKTKKVVDILMSFNVDNVLIVIEKPDENLEKSSRNIKRVKILRAEGLNVYDVLTHKYLLFSEPALGIVEEALA
ncbi:MAG TPA: 50S ribosomal protein L4 [Desulfatiglandales bacterium]|nr:50S ribosomal protein L4 [Desulfatiglandales bacterium]